jgi:hypothetical protein
MQFNINWNQDPKLIAKEVQKIFTNSAKNLAKWDY